MRALLIPALFALIPMGAQAVTVTHFAALAAECISIEICEKSGECKNDRSLGTTVSLEEDVLFGSFNPFAQRAEKWTRSLSFRAFDGSGEVQSTYRTLDDAETPRRMYRKASYDEHKNGWFGPWLPAVERVWEHDVASFHIWHTRQVPAEDANLFRVTDQQIIHFQCSEVK